MTQFKQFELIYNQLTNLTEEISTLIAKEDYQTATLKVEYKDKLLKQLLNARKTIKFTAEEKQKLLLMEQKMKENVYEHIEPLKKLRDEIGKEIKTINKKIKINSAYTSQDSEQQGIFFDTSE